MQVLPANQTLGVNKVAPKALPPNPVGAALAGKTVATPVPVASDLTGIATHIATNNTYSPAFVKALQDMQKHDPTFQDRLNAEVHRVSQGIQAKRDSTPLAMVGNIIEQGANPLEWVKGAVEGAPHVAQGVGKIAHGNIGGGAKEAGLGALGVAGVLPVGRVAKLGMEIKTARSAEQAAQHLSEVAAAAKAEGHAHVPLAVAKGAVTPETGGELGRQIRESLVHAPAVRAAQKAGYSEERGLRVKAAAEAALKAGGGSAGHLAAKRQLADPLSKEFFGHLKHLTPEQVDEVHRFIEKAPITFFQGVHAKDAIANAVEHGVAPTAGDHAILDRVFGTVAGKAPEAATTSSFWDKFVSYTNIPRAVRSSADISAGFRQGLVVLVTHPKVWGRAFAKSVKSFGSEEYYQAQKAAIESNPRYPLYVKWGVPFTDIGPAAGKVANTEEAFVGGQAAEHLHELPGIKGTPVGTALRPVSNVIRRSDRAFTGFQNEARFHIADMLAEKASLLGHDLNNEKLGTSIAKVAGTFTGRGVTPKILEGHLTTLNAMMFSPRLMAARLNLISPVYYYKLDPFARAEAMAGARNLVASIGTVMFVAKMLGADVNFDPRSSNFTKIKIGNTRIDIAGGFSQYVRFIAQEMTREAISSAGSKKHIGWGPNDISDLANATKLARSKAAPIPSLGWDELSGKDFIGQPVKQGHEAWSNAPFIAQDTRDALRQSGPKAAVVDAFLSAIGLGVQSYNDKPPGTGSSGNSPVWGDQGSSPSGSLWGDGGWTGP